MKKILCTIFTAFSFLLLHAQYEVTFILKENTSIIHDSIYVTGTFSNWDSSANNNYLMKPHGEKEKSITLNFKAGSFRYKFHRGSWAKVEKLNNGDEVPDREITIRKDTVLMDMVTVWRDEFLMDKRQALSQNKSDTNQVRIMSAMANAYAFIQEYYNSDSALYYAQQALQLLQKMKAGNEYKSWFREGNSGELIKLQDVTASLLHSLGNFPKALEIRLENLKLAEREKDKFLMVQAVLNISTDYASMKDYQRMLDYGKQMESILATLNKNDARYPVMLFYAKNTIATAYYNLNQLIPALNFAKQAINIDTKVVVGGFYVYGSLLLADIYAAMNETDSALNNYRLVNFKAPFYAPHLAARAQAGMARVFQKIGPIDSALLYARRSLTFFQNDKKKIQVWGESSDYYIAEISPLTADLYKANNQPDSAYKYLRLSVTIKDSLYNTDKVRLFQTLGFNEANRRQQLEQQSREEKQRYETKIKMYGLTSIITGFGVLAFVLYRNNKQKQKANTVLQSQKQEIENTLGELKNTQKQLIQSEKMASLGELTAGIAHEIQNPLNFVNNFSEVNKELLAEMKEEIDKGNMDEVKAIASDVIDNEEKINHHGKRAGDIVKGMLQHSRSSSGVKESTDINKLADEYLRLAYHGLRAKDKSFNATMKTDYDETIGNINIIPQDIGRVILNLITNAFYAASLPPPVGGGFLDPAYKHEPTIWVSTNRINTPSGDRGVLISVRDNGPGIPQKILDKIFQPFFTTKPTGQGTGLGLSLSYDIIKAHQGEIKVETRESEGSEFVIHLPLQ